MAHLAGGTGYWLGDCLLTVLLSSFSGKGYRFCRVTAQFNVQSGYVGDNLAEAKKGIFTLNHLHDRAD